MASFSTVATASCSSVVNTGIKPSTGAVGSSFDNALAESVIGLYKTELIKPRRPWKGFDDLELSTAEWVDWFNHRRPFEYCDDFTPVEAERAHYRHHQTPASQTSKSPDSPGRFNVSFRENHWRGLADLHTMAYYAVVTHAERAAELHQVLGRSQNAGS